MGTPPIVSILEDSIIFVSYSWPFRIEMVPFCMGSLLTIPEHSL